MISILKFILTAFTAYAFLMTGASAGDGSNNTCKNKIFSSIIKQTIIEPACTIAKEHNPLEKCFFLKVFDELDVQLENNILYSKNTLKELTENHLSKLTEEMSASLGCFGDASSTNSKNNENEITYLPQISKGFIRTLAALNSVLVLIAFILITFVVSKFIMVGASSATMFSGGISVLARPAKYGFFLALLFPISSEGGLSALQGIFILMAILGGTLASALLTQMEIYAFTNTTNLPSIQEIVNNRSKILSEKITKDIPKIEDAFTSVLEQVQARISISNHQLSAYHQDGITIPSYLGFDEISTPDAIKNCLYSGNYPDEFQFDDNWYHTKNQKSGDRIKAILDFITPDDYNRESAAKPPFNCYNDPIINQEGDLSPFPYNPSPSKLHTVPFLLADEAISAYENLLKNTWGSPVDYFSPDIYKKLLNQALHKSISCSYFKNNESTFIKKLTKYKYAVQCVNDVFYIGDAIQNSFYHNLYPTALIYSHPTSPIYSNARSKNSEICKKSLTKRLYAGEFGSGTDAEKMKVLKDKLAVWQTQVDSLNDESVPIPLWDGTKSSILPIQQCLIMDPLDKDKVKLSVSVADNPLRLEPTTTPPTSAPTNKYIKAYETAKTNDIITSFLKTMPTLLSIPSPDPTKTCGSNSPEEDLCLGQKYGWAGSGVLLLKFLSSTDYGSVTPRPLTVALPFAAPKPNNDFNDKPLESLTDVTGATNNLGEFIGERMFDNIIQHIVNKMIKTDLDNIRGAKNPYWGDELLKSEIYYTTPTNRTPGQDSITSFYEWRSPMIVMKKKLNYCFDNPAGCLVLQDHPIGDMVELGKLAISTSIYFNIFEWVFEKLELYLFPALASRVPLGTVIIFVIEWIAQYILFITAIAAPLLLLGGLTLVFIIPLTPLFFFAQALIQYIILLFEGLVALPVWGMLMVREERSAQDTQIGYSMFGQMLLYPPLVVISIFIGLIISKYGLILLNLMAYPLLMVVDIDGAGFLLGPIISVLIYISTYTILAFFIVKFSFSFINKFPNEVFTWLGISSVEEIDEGGIAQVAVVGVASSAVGKITQGVGKASTGAIDKYQESAIDKNQEKKPRDNPSKFNKSSK